MLVTALLIGHSSTDGDGVVVVSLTNVWVQTQGDGLVRADQITGIDAHQTPALSGKPARWLLDVVLGSSIGTGSREGWAVTVAHRTLIQTPDDPQDSPAALARLLAQLDLVHAAGVITTSRTTPTGPGDTGLDEVVTGSGQVRFQFVPFPHPAPGHHTGAEYLWPTQVGGRGRAREGDYFGAPRTRRWCSRTRCAGLRFVADQREAAGTPR